MSAGDRLVIIVGPSGTGKDSCIDWALQQLNEAHFVIRAHRYCTRPAGPGEDFVSLSDADFRRRYAIGAFALDWQANGLRYGIGIELDHWLEHGATVVVNGSRGALERCLQRYPAATVVHLTADTVVRAERLARRGREDRQAIVARLAREIPVELPGHHIHRIENNYELAHAGRQLRDLLIGVAEGQPALSAARNEL